MEKWYRKQFPKLKSVSVGYLGGTKKNPTYQDVCTGNTGHAEVVHMEFDPRQVSYRELCQFFFRIHDPTTPNRQGNDAGTQYRSAIFYYSDEQKSVADAVRAEMGSTHWKQAPIVTELTAASPFFRAEPYHQEYLTHNPSGYCNHKLRW